MILNFIREYLKKDVLLVAPNLNRDLPGYAHVSYILKTKYKMKTKILTNQNHDPLIHIPLYNPTVLFTCQVSTKYTKNMFEMYKNRNIKTVSLRTEGTMNEKCKPIFKSHYDYEDIVDLQIYWGKSFKTMIESFNEISSEKGVSCGNPSFDFYNPSYSKIYLGKKNFLKLYIGNKESYNKIVVIATNFVCSNKNVNNLETIPEILDNPTDEEIRICENLINRDLKSRLIITNVINDIAKKHQDILFVIKIHPFEGKKFYMRTLNDNPNVMLLKDELYLWDLINVSDVLLHPGSTVSIPFKMMNKPTVLYQFSDDNLLENELWDSDKRLITKDDFDVFLNDLYIDGKCNLKTNFDLSLFEKWFYKNDCNAAERCADEIYELISKNTNSRAKKTRPKFLKSFTVLIMRIINKRRNIILDCFNYYSTNKTINKDVKKIYAIIEKMKLSDA